MLCQNVYVRIISDLRSNAITFVSLVSKNKEIRENYYGVFALNKPQPQLISSCRLSVNFSPNSPFISVETKKDCQSDVHITLSFFVENSHSSSANCFIPLGSVFKYHIFCCQYGFIAVKNFDKLLITLGQIPAVYIHKMFYYCSWKKPRFCQMESSGKIKIWWQISCDCITNAFQFILITFMNSVSKLMKE